MERNIKIETMALGIFGTNCYIVYDDTTKKAAIIDPADNAARVMDFLDKNGLEAEAILLTHGHFDHIQAVPALKQKFGVPVCIHEKDMELIEDADLNASHTFGFEYATSADRSLKDHEKPEFLDGLFEVIWTPGHTAGSCCFYAEDMAVLFAGDTLFCESVGRTDLPTGNPRVLGESIKEKLFTLPENVRVYSGHGPATGIGYEKENNMWI